MRLYLSSFRLGDHPDRLLELAGAGRRVGVIANAMDVAPARTRREGVEREMTSLRNLGFVAQEIDLRHPDVARQMADVDAVWVRGGNTFVLRNALAGSGVEDLLVDRVANDDLLYAGYSAGPVLLAPTLRGLERVDDVIAVQAPIWDGLGVLDRSFVPHVDSPGHPETAACDSLSADFTRQGIPHWALRDGEVLVVDSGQTELLGRTNLPQ